MISRNYSGVAMSCLAMASMGCDFGQSLVIRSPQPFLSGRSVSRSRRARARSSTMKMYINDAMMPIDMASFSSSTTASVESTPSNILCATSKLFASDPQLEAEFLTDASYIALDMSTFLSPNTIWLRFLNVLGRVLVLSSDYIQDNHVSSDELVFQVSMLAFSSHMLIRSAWPLILATCSISTLTVRERRTYALLFEVVGLSILQFKTLLASKTLDWLEYAPGEIVELNGEYMYFLYSGDAATTYAGSKIDDKTDTSSREEGLHVCNRIFGDVQFAKLLEESVCKKAKKTSKSDKKKSKKMPTQEATHSTVAPRSSFTVGHDGASILRISTTKLLKLMKNDDELSGSIQRLVLLCMQEKLSRTLQLQPSTPSSSTPNATHAFPATG